MTAPTNVMATAGNASAHLTWSAPLAAVTGWRIQVRTGTTVVRTISLTTTAASTDVPSLLNGTAYNFRVAAVTAAGVGTFSDPSNTVTPSAPASVPGQPRIGKPAQGAPKGALTATAAWTAPASTGGSPILGYRVRALPLAADGTTVVGTPVVLVAAASARSQEFTLPAGTYRFDVTAFNAVGDGPASARSALVSPR